MQCESIQDMLSAYLDGEVSGAEQKQIAAHLAYCAGCREALSDLAAVDEAGKRDYVPDPGEAYWQRLNHDIKTAVDRAEAARISETTLRRNWRYRAMPISLSAAGLAVAAVLVFMLGRQMETDQGSLSREFTQGAVDVEKPDASTQTAVPMAKAAPAENRAVITAKQSETAETPVRTRTVPPVPEKGKVIGHHPPMRGGVAPAAETPTFFTVGGVSAPAVRKVAVSKDFQRASTPMTGADTLAGRIHALETALAALTDSLEIRALRVQQARLHYARARQCLTAEAIREARLFYVVYGAWLNAPPDSSELADNGQRLNFLLETMVTE